MIKQTLMFSSPAVLSLRNRQMVIGIKESTETVTRPIEDLGVVVIENQQVSITIPLLNALTDNNVAVVLCDDRQMPRSMLMSLEGNTTLQEAYRHQFAATEPTKKRAWKQIIESKIRNQASLLTNVGLDGDRLRPFYMNVRSGDSDNREGGAARIYWSMLFGRGFRREREGEAPNNLLNYCYAVLRAATARAIVGSGLYPAFGLFHRNRNNAFPLADDLMEPYRPFADEIVFRLYHDGAQETLNKDTKSELLRVLFADVKMGRVVRPLEVALSLTTASLLRIFKGEDTKLSLPEL